MNERSVVARLKELLEAATWSNGGRAFGQVLVTAGADYERIKGVARWPVAMIFPGAATVDEDSPQLAEVELTVKLVCAVHGDPWGEGAVLGGPGDGQGLASQGAGILRLQQVLYDTLGLLSAQDGVQIQLIAASAVGASLDEDHGYVADRDYVFRALVGVGEAP